MEPTKRPKVWVAQGTYFSKNDNIPNEADPITIEQRGNILRIQQSKRARYRHEGNRQRRDTKAKRYKQLLKFINLTYGNYSEVQEVVQAWQHSPNLSTFVEAIAINEAVDRMYGTQSKLINFKSCLYRLAFVSLLCLFPSHDPKEWVAQGTYFSKNDNIPNEADPITIEQRGNILRIQQSKRARYRHEGNRQRRDTKAKRYKQLLKFINLTYGNYSEVQEVVQAWQHSPNLSTFVEAIAINEAVDRMYGTQSKLKRDFIYKPLKVGGTPLALRSIWKLSR